MKRRWALLSAAHPSYTAAPERQRSVRGSGEWVDFRDKGDGCTIFLRLPGHVCPLQVQQVMQRYGPIRQLSSCGEALQDGSWVAVVGFYSNSEAMAAVGALNGQGGARALFASPLTPAAAVGAGVGAAGSVDSPAGAPTAAPVEQYDLFRARLGLKHQGGSSAEDGFLSAQQSVELLNHLLPFQWSNTMDVAELQAQCAPKKPAKEQPGYTLLPGGVLGKWDAALGAFLPLAKDLACRGHWGELPTKAEEGGAEEGGEEGGEEGTAGAEGAGGAKAASSSSSSRNFVDDEDDDADPEAPLDGPGQQRQLAKFEDMFKRNPDLCSADALASAEGMNTRLGHHFCPLITVQRPPGPQLTSLFAAQKSSSSSSSAASAAAAAVAASNPSLALGRVLPRPPCAFVRQVILVHNRDGTAAVSCSAGGCTCRHRDEEPLAMMFEGAAEAAQPGSSSSSSSSSSFPRPYLTVNQGFVCGGPSPPPQDAAQASDELLPLSQQLEPPPQGSAVGAGGKRARRARGHLKARQWTVGELLDGAPLKFTAAEAFRRACDRLRVWVPKV